MSTQLNSKLLLDIIEEDDEESSSTFNQPQSYLHYETSLPQPKTRKVIPYNTLLSSSLMNDVVDTNKIKPTESYPIPKKLKTTHTSPSTINTSSINKHAFKTTDATIKLWPESTHTEETPLKKQAELLKLNPKPKLSTKSSSLLNFLPPPTHKHKSHKTLVFKTKVNAELSNKSENSLISETSKTDSEQKPSQIKESDELEKNKNSVFIPDDGTKTSNSDYKIIEKSIHATRSTDNQSICNSVNKQTHKDSTSPQLQESDKLTTNNFSTNFHGATTYTHKTKTQDEDMENLQSLFSGYSSDEGDEDDFQPTKGYFTVASPYSVKNINQTDNTHEKKILQNSVDDLPITDTNLEFIKSTDTTLDSNRIPNLPQNMDNHTVPPVPLDSTSLPMTQQLGDPFYNLNGNYYNPSTNLPPPNFPHLQQSIYTHSPKVDIIENTSMRPRGREWKELHDVDTTVSTISASSLQNPNWYMENKLRNEPNQTGSKKYTQPTRIWSVSDGASVTVAEPKRLQKHKHQINWLAKEAHERESEINAITARARQHKYDSRLKYGW